MTSDDCCNDEKCHMQSCEFSDPDTLGPGAPADVGVTFQQTLQQSFTDFYHEEGPAEFTASDDT